MGYRCVATTLEGFVQQLAVAFVGHGYVHYVMGQVPEGKAPEAVDAKLLKTYGVDASKWAKARRKVQGKANVQYVRFERQWVLLATEGQHENLFRFEAGNIRDARETPIRVGGYAISRRGGHAHVRIDLPDYRRLKDYLVEIAKHRRKDAVEAEFARIRFTPYAPIRRQVLCIWRAANKARHAAGFQELSKWCVKLERRNVRVFAAMGEPAA